ncbi:winged helix-turn-helix domain-containing protein [Intrasporangium mesophilum]
MGLPLQEVTRIARMVHDSAVVLATNDVAAARALLAPVEDVEQDEAVGSVGTVGISRSVPVGAESVPASAPASAGSAHSVHLAIAPIRPQVVSAGPLAIDLAGREVTADGKTLHLSAREFDLLALLASDVGRVWSFAALTEGVWGTDYLGDREQLTSTVKRLRRRLGVGSGCEVRSVHGVGYRLRVPGG